MLTEIVVKGRTAQEVAAMPKEELLEEIGIPLTPVRLKCAILGLGVLKVALHRSKGTPLPEEWARSWATTWRLGTGVRESRSARVDELPPGTCRSCRSGPLAIGVYNCGGELLRARGSLLPRRRAALRGRFGGARAASRSARATAPRFDITSGRPLTLPAYQPVDSFPVRVEDGWVRVEVG